MKKTIIILFIVIILLIVIFISRCGNKPAEKSAAKKKSVQENHSTVQTEKKIIDRDPDWDPIADPRAVKGGSYTTWGGPAPKSLNYWLATTTFNSQIAGLLFDGLVSLHSTRNEEVGGLADRWEISDDKKTFTFHIKERAVWSDGKPVTSEDIQFYYDVIMDPANLTSPFRVSMKRFDRPEVLDSKTIRMTAKESHWNNFWTAAGMTAFPKHVWEDVDFNKQNFEFPVVSGPYRIKEVKKNRYVALERRKDWWAKDEKYNLFKYNFDEIKYRFTEDRIKALELFKKEQFDAYAIYTSSIWMKQTNFDQVKKNWVIRQKIYNMEPKGFQGIAMNLRREKFQDVRLRRALCFLINLRLMNKKLMYDQYFLLNSYYPDLYPDNINPEIPVQEYNPDKARALLDEAGWKVGDDGLLRKDGEKLKITFMTFSADLRHLTVYMEDLKKVGIDAGIERLDAPTVFKRLDTFDFDMYWSAWGASRLRDPESLWSSETAGHKGTNNYPGVEDKIIDRLIEQQKTEMSLDKRNEILKKIDTRLNEIVPYVLLWQAAYTRLLYWNKFGTPDTVLDKYNREDSAIVYCWHDKDKDKALREAQRSNTVLPAYEAEIHYKE